MHRRPATKGRRGWNRGDLAILLCGVLGFLSLTFGAPLFQHEVAGAAETGAPVYSTRTTSEIPWPLSAKAAPADFDEASAVAEVPAVAVAGPVLPEASAPQRIHYAAAAIDTAIHPLDPDSSAVASQTIEPPTTMDGYWLTPFGTPGHGSNNTTYIIGHSWEGRDAPFNHLSSAATIGDEFAVVTSNGTIHYRVDSVTTYLKATLKDSPIWDMVPNRLVLISCYTEDPWGKNVVVTASPIAG